MPTKSDNKDIADTTYIVKSASSVSVAIFISRIFGYLRDLVIASVFGANFMTDAYFLALRIPNAFRSLTAEGGMSRAYIPILGEVYERSGKAAAVRLTNNLFSLLTLSLIILVGSFEIFAPEIIFLIAPGFQDNLDQVRLAVNMTRMMLPYLILISIASLLSSYVNYFRSFFIPNIANIAFSLCVIGSSLFLRDIFNDPIYAAAFGGVTGGFVHMLIVLVHAKSYHFRYRYHLDIKDKDIRSIGKLLIPSFISSGSIQVNILVSSMLASLLIEGSISFLYYANLIVNVAVSMFGVSVGIVALPSLSGNMAKSDINKFKDTLSYSTRIVLFAAIPAAAFFSLLSNEMVNILLERGEFTEFARKSTATAIIMYAVGLPAVAISNTLIAAFYALKKSLLHSTIQVIAVIINILLSIILMNDMQHNGLALANSLSAFANISMQIFFINRILGSVNFKRIAILVVKSLVATLLMSVAVYAVSESTFSYDDNLILRAGSLALSVIAGAIVYIISILVLKMEETFVFKKIIFK